MPDEYLDDCCVWSFKSSESEFNWRGAIDWNNTDAQIKIEKYLKFIEDLQYIVFPGGNPAALGFIQITVINRSLPKIIKLLFGATYTRNEQKILSYLRIENGDDKLGLIMILSRRCGKSSAVAFLISKIAKHFPGLLIQLFATSQDQSTRILEMSGALNGDCETMKMTKKKLDFKGENGLVSSIQTNPNSEV